MCEDTSLGIRKPLTPPLDLLTEDYKVSYFGFKSLSGSPISVPFATQKFPPNSLHSCSFVELHTFIF